MTNKKPKTIDEILGYIEEDDYEYYAEDIAEAKKALLALFKSWVPKKRNIASTKISKGTYFAGFGWNEAIDQITSTIDKEGE